MKILVLTDYISPDEKGGSWEYAYKISRYAADICQVSLCCFMPAGQKKPAFEQDGNLKIYRVKNSFGIKPEIRKIEHDIAFIHTSKFFGIYRLTMRFSCKPVVFMIHGTSYLERLYNKGRKDLKYWALKIFEKYEIRSSDGILFLSDYMRNNSIKNFSAMKKTAIIPAGIEKPVTGKIKPEEKSLQSMVQTDIKKGYKILFCLRRLVPRTGVLFLPEMMYELRDLKVKLYIGGSGVQKDLLNKKIKDLNLTETVIPVGLISDELKNWMYSKSWLSVVPTQALEGFGLSMLESLNYGCPAVITPVGGMYEFLADKNFNELITPGFSPEEIAYTVRNLVKNPSLRNSLSREGKKLAAGFNYKNAAQKVLSTISYMLEKTGFNAMKDPLDGKK